MSDTAPPGPRRALVAGGVSGLLAGLAAVAVSEAVAAVLTGVTSPLLAVGNRAVDTTPRPVKEWAISTFGAHDKLVLIGGVVATVALVAAVAGALGVRRPRLALGAFLALSVVAGLAVSTDRTSTAGPAVRLLPVLALVVGGVAALLLLLRVLQPGPGTDDVASTFDRRAFLQAAAVVGGVAVAGAGVRQVFRGSAAPAGRARVPRS